MPKANETMQRRERVEGPPLTRSGTIGADGIIDKEARLVRVSFSSEQEVLRTSWWDDPWKETLGHNANEVDLSRLNSTAPVLYNHSRYDQNKRIGVVQRAWLENGRGYAEIKISSRNDEMDGLWKDIDEGILRNISVGYKILERTLVKSHDDSPDEYRVTNWEPMEVSFVDIPADATVGVGRSEANQEERGYTVTPILSETADVNSRGAEMPKETKPKEGSQSAAAVDNQQTPVDQDALRQEGVTAERQRVADINQVFEPFADTHSELRSACIADPEMTAERAKDKMLDALGQKTKPIAGSVDVRVVDDEKDRYRRGATNAILLKAGILSGDAARQEGSNEFRSFSLRELARESLTRAGVVEHGFSSMDMVGRAFTHSTSDFGNILQDVINKALLKGYDEAQETFQQWTVRGSASDFRPQKRVDMGAAPILDLVDEGGEYRYGTIGDRGETVTIATYGKILSITRQAIINDDLSILSRIPSRMGRAAVRTVGNMAYNTLTTNAAMSDGTALFHANHNNLASSGAAPSVTTLDAARTAMAKQTEGAGKNKITLNIRPAYMLVPVGLEGLSRQLMNSVAEPGQDNPNIANRVAGMAEVISDARLDADSATAWYLAANGSMHDTVEITYLDGNETPYVEQKDGWNVDGTKFKIRLDAAATPLDFRTLYKNAGA